MRGRFFCFWGKRLFLSFFHASRIARIGYEEAHHSQQYKAGNNLRVSDNTVPMIGNETNYSAYHCTQKKRYSLF